MKLIRSTINYRFCVSTERLDGMQQPRDHIFWPFFARFLLFETFIKQCDGVILPDLCPPQRDQVLDCTYNSVLSLCLSH